MKRITPWFSLCIPLFLVLAAPAQGQSHSAFADHEDDDGWAVGYALGYDTAVEAGANAIEVCEKEGAGKCLVVHRFVGAGCAAIAESKERMGYGFGGPREDAEQRAMRECKKRGGNCRIVDSDCVGSGKVAQSNVVEKESTTATAGSPGGEFRDCDGCPVMVVIPGGEFVMGSPSSEEARHEREGPQHRVTVGKFAVGKYEVTFDEWEACRRAGGCSHNPGDEGWGRGNRPVINVSWDDAKEYVKWLSKKTGKRYRLLTESEWEYAARAGTTTPFHTGRTISTDQANYYGDSVYGSGRKGVYRRKTVAVGSFPANQFGLHDMHGNVWEWVEDCWHDNYQGAPSNGSAWTTGGDCAVRVLRGGSWDDVPWYLRAAYRNRNGSANRDNFVGFGVARVARTLTP